MRARKSLTWLHWLSLLLLLVPLLAIFQLPMPSSGEVVSLQLAFTPDTFGSIYSQWTPEETKAFADHFPLDFLFIAAYALAGYVWAGTWLLPVALLPLARWVLPVAGVLDVGENLLEMYLLQQLPDLPATAVMLAATCACLKWVGTGVFVLLLGYALGRR